MAAMTATAIWTLLWPSLLPWLIAAILPWLLAAWPLRDLRHIRWAATDIVATAAHRAGLGRRGVPWLLVALRGLVLAAIAVAAARPMLVPRQPPVGRPVVVGSAARRIEIVTAPSPDSALAIRRGLEALAATPSAVARGGAPAVDMVAPPAAGMPFDGQRLIILCDGAVPEPTDAERIGAAVRAGSGLLVCLGPDTLASVARPAFAAWLSEMGGLDLEAAIPVGEAMIDATGLAAADAETLLVGPTVRMVAGISFSAPSWRVWAQTGGDARPLVVETSVGSGRLGVATIPLTIAADALAADTWSDLAAWPAFLPFLDRLCSDLMAPASTTAAVGTAATPRFIGRAFARVALGMAAAALLAEWAITRWLHRRRYTAWLSRGILLGLAALMAAIWGDPPRAQPPADPPPGPVALLVDTSPSMATPDVPMATGEQSRLAAIQQAFAAHGDVARVLARGRNATLTTIASALDGQPSAADAASLSGLEISPAATHASRLGDAIARLVSGSTAPAAVVVASDGAISDGLPWADVARLLHQRRVPLVAVPVGAGGRSPRPAVPFGLRFTAIDAPRICQPDERLNVAVRAAAAVPHHGPLAVTGPGGQGRLASIDTAAERSFGYRFAGICTDELRLDMTEKPTIQTRAIRIDDATSPVATYPVVVSAAPIRVLIVDAVPRFEVRFLERLLAGDARFDVSTCLVGVADTPGLRPTAPLPKTVDAWLGYDVVVLGDVPIAAASDTAAPAWAALRAAAEQDGLGIAWLPGRRWALDDLGLRSWLPAMPQSAAIDTASRRLALSPAGRREWFAFLPDGAGDAAAFSPEIFAVLADIAVQPMARIMATARAAGSGTAAPAVITSRLGAATLVGHFCDTWRWRDDAGGDVHGRYWAHLLARLAEHRRLARLTAALLAVRPCDPVVGETLSIDIVPTRRETDLTGWTIDIATIGQAKRSIAVPPSPAGLTPTVAVAGLAAGRHTLTLAPPAIAANDRQRLTIAREIIVNEPAREAAGDPAGIDPMLATAAASGGEIVPLERVESLAAVIDRVAAKHRAAVAAAGPTWFESHGFAHLLVAAAVVAGAAAWWPRAGASS